MSLHSDSDSELQEAYARGDLKPGLNVPVQVITRESVNDATGLKQILNEIRLELKWDERLDMINGLAPLAPEVSKQFEKKENNDDPAHDEFTMEMNFYRQAQSAVLEGISRLNKLGIQTKRPVDFYAEMAKSDNHMQKIKDKLVSKQTALERSQKAKKLRELRKYGKKIQTEVIQQRHKEKKEMMEAVKRYRKGDESNLNFLDGAKNGKNGQMRKGNTKSAEKKKFKEARYGYGGKKKRSKYNTAKSSSEMTGFSSKRNSKTSKRPGKERRQNIKNRKR